MRLSARIAATAPALVLACTVTAPAADAVPSVPQDDRSRCAAMCERIAACDPPADFVGAAACTSACVDDPRQHDGPCRAPRLAYEACVTALPCDEVRAERATASLVAPGPCLAARQGLLDCEPDPPAPHIDFQF